MSVIVGTLNRLRICDEAWRACTLLWFGKRGNVTRISFYETTIKLSINLSTMNFSLWYVGPCLPSIYLFCSEMMYLPYRFTACLFGKKCQLYPATCPHSFLHSAIIVFSSKTKLKIRNIYSKKIPETGKEKWFGISLMVSKQSGQTSFPIYTPHQEMLILLEISSHP